MKKITLVSTDKQLLSKLNDAVTELGFEVEKIAEPDHLFEKIKHNHPFILIIDFIPQDGNTAAICHQLKSDQSTRDIHIIILSDYSGIEQFASKSGSFSIVKKPVSITELIENIHVALHEHTTPL